MHLDIAGTAYTESDLGTIPRGPTGVPVGTFVEFVRGRTRWSHPLVRLGRLCGHGVLAVAILYSAAAAQATHPPPPPGRVPSAQDSAAVRAARDSAEKKFIHDSIIAADSIKGPIAHAAIPLTTAMRDSRWHWDHAAINASGALNVADLLDHIPGVSTFRAGWQLLPMVAGVAGDFRRVRVFLDGVELDALDPRAGGVLDLSQIPLWQAEDVLVERRAGEVLVHIRSWRVNRTTPYTRTDVATGDVQSNVFALLYGKRGNHGEVIQLAAQQFGMTPPDFLGTASSQTTLLSRLGWASKEGLSIDGFATRVNLRRGRNLMDVTDDSIPVVTSSRTDAYIRAARGDPDSSRVWSQLILATSIYGFKGARAAGEADSISSDSSRSESQIVLTGGMNREAAGATLTARLRSKGGKMLLTPELRGHYEHGIATSAAWIEGKSADSLSRAGVSAEFLPAPRIRVNIAAEGTRDRLLGTSETGNAERAEVGVLWRDLWFTGGAIRRDSTQLVSPAIINLGAPTLASPAVLGATAAIDGRVWRQIHGTVSAIRWTDSTGIYRPQYQERSELSFQSNFLQRFPRGNFGLKALVSHEYRSAVIFPNGAGSLLRAADSRIFSSLLEIRINGAVVTWQFQNFRGERYHQIPGYRDPRQTQFYGVRWVFWN